MEYLVSLLGIFVVIFVGMFFISRIEFFVKKKMRSWDQNKIVGWVKPLGLSYKKELKEIIGGESNVINIIWGNYRGSRIFSFSFMHNYGLKESLVAAIHSAVSIAGAEHNGPVDEDNFVGYVFINNAFFDVGGSRSVEIINLLSSYISGDSDKIRKLDLGSRGKGTGAECIIITIANIYINQGELMEYEDCAKVVASVANYYENKQELSDKIVSALDNKYTKYDFASPEAIAVAIEKNKSLDKGKIKLFLEEYQKLIKSK